MLVVFAAVAAALVGAPYGPRSGRAASADPGVERLLEQRRELYAELREVDDDAAAGRISAEDRVRARRALAPRLRAVTEALRGAGIEQGHE
ncbi:MAG: hypothetical protein AB7U23_14100 [Dehalococcoidia bacterium]